MSKPDPAITANLLNQITEPKAEFHEDGAPSRMTGQRAAEASPKPGSPKAKLSTSRRAPAPGHMRSSPRGK